MTELDKTIQKDLVDAQKSKDQEKLETLRMVLAEIKNRSIDSKKDLKEKEVQEILRKEIKKRKDSIKAFKDGGRDELAQKEEREIAIIEKYLPNVLDFFLQSTQTSKIFPFKTVINFV